MRKTSNELVQLVTALRFLLMLHVVDVTVEFVQHFEANLRNPKAHRAILIGGLTRLMFFLVC